MAHLEQPDYNTLVQNLLSATNALIAVTHTVQDSSAPVDSHRLSEDLEELGATVTNIGRQIQGGRARSSHERQEASGPSTENSAKTTSFTLFPQLPLEIRMRIWELACFFPRNVDIWVTHLPESYIREPPENYTRGGPPTPFRYLSRSPVPAILHVCNESRTIGLNFYKLEFGSGTFELQYFTLSVKPTIYVNLSVDRICFMDSCGFQNLVEIAKINGTKFLVWM